MTSNMSRTSVLVIWVCEAVLSRSRWTSRRSFGHGGRTDLDLDLTLLMGADILEVYRSRPLEPPRRPADYHPSAMKTRTSERATRSSCRQAKRNRRRARPPKAREATTSPLRLLHYYPLLPSSPSHSRLLLSRAPLAGSITSDFITLDMEVQPSAHFDDDDDNNNNGDHNDHGPWKSTSTPDPSSLVTEPGFHHHCLVSRSRDKETDRTRHRKAGWPGLG